MLRDILFFNKCAFDLSKKGMDYNMNEVGKINRHYEIEEIESMNIIFGKNQGNNWFSRDELSFANSVDLYNIENLAQVKIDWNNSFIE